jgi:hypothetical protein
MHRDIISIYVIPGRKPPFAVSHVVASLFRDSVSDLQHSTRETPNWQGDE